MYNTSAGLREAAAARPKRVGVELRDRRQRLRVAAPLPGHYKIKCSQVLFFG